MKSVNESTSPSRWARFGLGRWAATSLMLVAIPSLVSAQTLLHRYSFATDVSDSVGNATGTLVGPNGGSVATIANGLTLPGGGGPGFSGYVALPAGILTNTSSLTIECWATQAAQNNWAELYNFNNGTGQYVGYIPTPQNNNNNMSAAFKTSNNESDAFSSVLYGVGTPVYSALTLNATTLVGKIYTNGAQVASVTVPNATYIPGNYGGASGTLNNYIGQDPWPDPQFQGTVYEFRIWNGVVSQRYLAASTLAGPTVVITNLTPTSASIIAGPSVIVTGTEQAAVTVRLQQTGTADIVATADVTNWSSSNPSVLAVTSGGVIAGVSVGSATISAKIGTFTATSSAITVTGPQQLLHRYSFATDLTDSVGGANGTNVPPGNASGASITVANGLTLAGGGGGGYSGYVALPAGILTNTTSLTVECWMTQAAANTWATPWDFANNGNQNFELCTKPGNNNNHMEAAFTPHGNETDVQSSLTFPNGTEQYVALTYNNYTLVANIYTNGAVVATATMPDTTYAPAVMGGGLNVNALGNDIYGDSQWQGTIYEFRIWNGARSALYVELASAAGSSVVVTNLTPQSLNLSVATSMVGAGTQQAVLTGTFAQVSGVNVSGGATNWLSSNTNVVTVNSSGLITAINGGSATVSATVYGVTATSASITVASTPPVFSTKPSSLSVAAGDPVTFTSVALGGSLHYQWSFDSTPISGATNSVLTLANVTTASSGTYTVTVSNTLGTTNASAMLTVSQAILLHRYSFVSDASDSVGTANGTVVPPNGGSAATIANGLTLPGGGGPGFSGIVSLPANILTNTHSLTIECWTTQNSANTWAEVYSFNNGTAEYIAFIPYPGNNNANMEGAFRTGNNEDDAQSTLAFGVGSPEYVVMTVDASTLTGKLYYNGALVGSVNLPNSGYIPGNYGGGGGTANNLLGQDPWPDPQYQGVINEFRIWDGAVSPLYLAISAQAGPGNIVTSTVPTSISVMVNNSTMTVGQSQAASATGDFQGATDIPVTTSVTNWFTSNPSVLTVDASGNVTAVGSGSATVSAIVNGVTGTSSSITVPASAPIITVEPSASVTLAAGATLRASVSAIGNAPFTYYWYYNSGSTPVSTSGSPTFTIANVQAASDGNYFVVVSNQYGTATSSTLSLTVVPPTPYEQVVMQLGAVAFWPLSETDGNVAYDQVGGNNGTYIGGYSLGQPGPTNAFFGSDTSAAFDGASSYVDVPSTALDLTNAVTCVAWVNLEAYPGFGCLIGRGDQSYRISINGSGQAGANDGGPPGDATAPSGFAPGNWHMVSYSYTGNTNQDPNGTLCVDGQPVAFNWVFVTPAGGTNDLWIGGAPDYGLNRLLPAYIADCAVFNTGLSVGQIQALYNGTYASNPQTVTITASGANVVISWSAGALQSASAVTGPWTTVPGAGTPSASPLTVPANAAAKFYRVLVNP